MSELDDMHDVLIESPFDPEDYPYEVIVKSYKNVPVKITLKKAGYKDYTFIAPSGLVCLITMEEE